MPEDHKSVSIMRRTFYKGKSGQRQAKEVINILLYGRYHQKKENIMKTTFRKLSIGPDRPLYAGFPVTLAALRSLTGNGQDTDGLDSSTVLCHLHTRNQQWKHPLYHTSSGTTDQVGGMVARHMTLTAASPDTRSNT